MATDQLSSTFSALADPTRRAILARLVSGETSVTELAEPFKMSLPAISKHLKVLERAGLIARGREAQWRPCRIEARPLRDVADWVEGYRRFWEESFDRLDEYLRELKAREAKNSNPKNPQLESSKARKMPTTKIPTTKTKENKDGRSKS
jgi:DNA-binding transcriptional ArsR family regulator